MSFGQLSLRCLEYATCIAIEILDIGPQKRLAEHQKSLRSIWKYTAVVQAPLMADLPRERVEKVEFPFTYVGVEYFGPIEVKHMRKTSKRWVCVFICLLTRAIHLEMVYSLDTDSCRSAVMRFTARIGHPSIIWSDNGTNFVRANYQLKRFASRWHNSDFQEKLQRKKII